MSFTKSFLACVSKTCKNKFSTSGADSLGGLGSGAGRGGGSGGSIREAGGSLGKFGAAKEEEYFYMKQREQLEDLNKDLQEKLRCCQTKEGATKVEDLIYMNRKRIAQLDQCFRKKKK